MYKSRSIAIVCDFQGINLLYICCSLILTSGLNFLNWFHFIVLVSFFPMAMFLETVTQFDKYIFAMFSCNNYKY